MPDTTKSRHLMRTSTPCALVVSIASWAVLAAPLAASDPLGIYAIVDKVVLEPDDAAPQRVQVWGAFALSDGQSGDGYGAPQVGYVYYTCPQGQDRTCRNEWADIKSVAGKGVGIGFGGRYFPTGRIRKAGEKLASPDAYPIRMGVVRMSSLHDQPAIVTRLKAALAAR
jgi:hypothetical protein